MTRRLAFAALFTAFAVNAALTAGLAPALAGYAYPVVEALAAGLVGARALTVRRHRAGWALVALALSFGVCRTWPASPGSSGSSTPGFWACSSPAMRRWRCSCAIASGPIRHG